MTAPVVVSLTLPPEARSVGRAREAVREVVPDASPASLLEAAQLAISELVTNAVVHAGTEIEVRILVADGGLRVEVTDGSVHLPVMRAWSPTSGTGRGLHVVDQSAERWDVDASAGGKTVWFEIGRPPARERAGGTPRSVPGDTGAEDAVRVVLLDAPLLMHLAWQEHAATLLREYLLFALDADPTALQDHATASKALSILEEQLPAPSLSSDPEVLMADSVEPDVTAGELTLEVPRASVPYFEVLDDVLSRAVVASRAGHLLGPPTQPEIAEMRRWLCGEIAAQADGHAAPRPWRAHTGGHDPLEADAERARLRQGLERLHLLAGPVVATDEDLVIVAAAAPVVALLGYEAESELLGRRILSLIPARYHQAHIAGVTFHATNGRDVLLDRWITVPVVRADGGEVPVEVRVEPRRLDADHRVFVATFRVDESRRQE